MSELLESCRLANLDLNNRFVRSATWEGMAPDTGEVTDKLVELYRELAKGGVGLIITGSAFVDPRGRCLPGHLGIDNDGLMPGLTRIAGVVHHEGGTVVLQITHGGAQTVVDTGMSPEAPSAVEDRFSGNVPVEMTRQDIERVVNAFGEAGRRSKECGFDGVQFLTGHGYLLSEFLSPYTNVRTDEYGGPIENRARIVFEIYDAIRSQVGSEFPIMVKVNVTDFDGVGLDPDESLWVCEQLDEKGIDAIELSGGVHAAGPEGAIRGQIDSPEKEAYFKEHAERFTPRLKCPVMLVGGIRSLDVAEKLYREGTAHFVSMCRPLISEPGLVNRWAAGDTEPARCISCTGCVIAGLTQGGIRCTAFED